MNVLSFKCKKKSTPTVSCTDRDKTVKLDILVKGLTGVTNVRDTYYDYILRELLELLLVKMRETIEGFIG